MASRGRGLARAVMVPARAGFVSTLSRWLPTFPRGRDVRVASSLGAPPRGYHVDGATNPVLADGNLSLETPAFCVWGANTAVGKTLVSAGLAASARRRAMPFLYLKPVQTGFPDDSDADFVATRSRAGIVTTMGPHASVAAGMPPDRGTERPMDDGGGGAYPFWAHTTFAWRRAVGPHVAVAEEGRAVGDRALLRSVTSHLAQFADTIVGPNAGGFLQDGGAGVALVETAGGVCSPAPSGFAAVRRYRPMRLPAVLVGDGHLGGISTTITAFDVLTMRGYDVVAILVPDGGYGNTDAIRAYAEPRRAPRFRCRASRRGASSGRARSATARRFTSGWTRARACSTRRCVGWCDGTTRGWRLSARRPRRRSARYGGRSPNTISSTRRTSR